MSFRIRGLFSSRLYNAGEDYDAADVTIINTFMNYHFIGTTS